MEKGNIYCFRCGNKTFVEFKKDDEIMCQMCKDEIKELKLALEHGEVELEKMLMPISSRNINKGKKIKEKTDLEDGCYVSKVDLVSIYKVENGNIYERKCTNA